MEHEEPRIAGLSVRSEAASRREGRTAVALEPPGRRPPDITNSPRMIAQRAQLATLGVLAQRRLDVLGPILVNADATLERETDAMGRQAVQLKGGSSGKGGKSKSEGKGAKQEIEWQKKIKEHFPQGRVTIAGDSKANADITAQDGQRLWLFEVKGNNHWQSQHNIGHAGNVPAKQLGNKLLGKLGKV